MAQIGYRGAASVHSIGPMNSNGENEISFSTPAGWHFTWWGLSVLVIVFFLWAL